jgi:hypothetical protein
MFAFATLFMRPAGKFLDMTHAVTIRAYTRAGELGYYEVDPERLVAYRPIAGDVCARFGVPESSSSEPYVGEGRGVLIFKNQSEPNQAGDYFLIVPCSPERHQFTFAEGLRSNSRQLDIIKRMQDFLIGVHTLGRRTMELAEFTAPEAGRMSFRQAEPKFPLSGAQRAQGNAQSGLFGQAGLRVVKPGTLEAGTEYFHHIQSEIKRTAMAYAERYAAKAHPESTWSRKQRIEAGQIEFHDKFKTLTDSIKTILARRIGPEAASKYLGQFQSWLAATDRPILDPSQVPFVDFGFPGATSIKGGPQDSIQRMLRVIADGEHPGFPEFAEKLEPLAFAPSPPTADRSILPFPAGGRPKLPAPTP